MKNIVLAALAAAATAMIISCATIIPPKDNIDKIIDIVHECGSVRILNATGTSFDDEDIGNLLVASNRCKHHFHNSPCLKKFEKLGYHNYHATCGVKDGHT